jgi:predicted amidophosphoribosyltransferase
MGGGTISGTAVAQSRLASCPVCSQALPVGGPCPNRWCRRGDRAWSVVFAAGAHDRALRRAVVRYKYRGERWWAAAFARTLADYLAARATWFEEFDLLVPMPCYQGLSARRGWDPVGEIAVRLGPLVAPAWEMQYGAVVKRAETPAMQGHDWAARQAIATGPLRRSLWVPDPAMVAGARVLVLDDVLTEGSTLREVARALRLAGAREVAGLVLARPRWRERPPSGL